MMVEEYGVEPHSLTPSDAVKELKDSLKEWRISQVKAVIRDMPLLAIEYLEKEGFRVEADPSFHVAPVDPHDYFVNRVEKLFDL